MATGISNQGRDAEALFLGLVNSSRKARDAASGDAVVSVDGVDIAIEIKKCDSVNGLSGTINQVRAIKFIPMVVYNPSVNLWYVVPATELVRVAAGKSRGQHTEIPFESMNMSLRQIVRWRCTPADLDATVRSAIRFDRENRILGVAMVAMLADIKRACERHRSEVARLLETVETWAR